MAALPRTAILEHLHYSYFTLLHQFLRHKELCCVNRYNYEYVHTSIWTPVQENNKRSNFEEARSRKFLSEIPHQIRSIDG